MATDTQEHRFSAIEARLAALEALFNQIEKRLESLERQVSDLRIEFQAEIRSLNGRLLWMWITTILAILGAHYLR